MRVLVEAYGCTLNQGEGRRIAAQLAEAGHRLVDHPDRADACVLVTCTVIETTERKMVKRMRQLAQGDRQLIVAGCMAPVQAETIRSAVPEAELLPPTEMERLPELLPGVGDPEYACFEPRSTIDGIIPITQGCLASCTYCISTIARGGLRSYAPEQIVAQTQGALTRGRREIRLSALDTGQYGRDRGTHLGNLLHRVCALDGDFRVRVGMMSPMMLRPILDDLVEAYQEKKVFNFLHLPVQSGNDAVLARMRRGYTVAKFWEAVEAFREAVHPLTLATDAIVGFPGETPEAFEETVALLKELKPDIINVTRFSARPGTPAATMEGQVSGGEMKRRSRELTRLRFALGEIRHRAFLGAQLRVLTTEEGKGETTMARSDDYRPVVLPGTLPLGEFCSVKVVGASPIYLKGVVLPEASPLPVAS